MVKFKLLGRHWFESSQSHFYKKKLKNIRKNKNEGKERERGERKRKSVL